MRKITLSGRIEIGSIGAFSVILLVDSDGYKKCLNYRFQEIAQSFPNNACQVSYYLSDKEVTENDMIKANLLAISGAIQSEMEANSYSYSSWTSGTDYDVTLKIGGHDLHRELSAESGKFIIMQIKIAQ